MLVALDEVHLGADQSVPGVEVLWVAVVVAAETTYTVDVVGVQTHVDPTGGVVHNDEAETLHHVEDRGGFLDVQELTSLRTLKMLHR